MSYGGSEGDRDWVVVECGVLGGGGCGGEGGVVRRRNVWFPDELWGRLVDEAARRSVLEVRRVSVAEVIRDLVQRGLEAE